MVIKRYPCAYTASLGLQVTKWVSEGWQAAGLSCIHFVIVRVNAYIPMILPVHHDSLCVVGAWYVSFTAMLSIMMIKGKGTCAMMMDQDA
jgi:hypothetical protein